MQWKCLPIPHDAHGKPAIHYTTVYKVFAKLAEDGSLWQAFVASVAHLANEKKLDLRVLHSDGTNTVAKKGVAHVLVPAAQHAPDAIHPSRRPLHDPPSCLDAGLLCERLGLFPPRADVGGEATCGQQLPHRRLVLACVPTPPLGGVGGRLRPRAGATRDGRPSPLAIMALRPLPGAADRHATAVGEHAARGADLAPVGRVLAHLCPPHGALGSWPPPARAMPRHSPGRQRLPPRLASTTPGRRPLRSTLERDAGRSSWHRGPSRAAPSTGRRGGARRRWPPAPAAPRRGAAGTPGGRLARREQRLDARPPHVRQTPITVGVLVVIMPPCGS